jgi:signal transduction histidine kinase
MLHEFLAENRAELERRCMAKGAQRPAPTRGSSDTQFGVPLFIGQLIDTLRDDQAACVGAKSAEHANDIGNTAKQHGTELLRNGFSVDEVVHNYGDLCQAITELALERKMPISVAEFHTFNRCLDGAIADAVTEFGRMRDLAVFDESTRSTNAHLGTLAQELQNLLQSATFAFQAMETGNVGVHGATGAVLARSLAGLAQLIDRAFAETRLTSGPQTHPEWISVGELLDEIRISAAVEATAKGLSFTVSEVEDDLAITADRQMLSAAIAGLLRNAFKFTRTSGHVLVQAYSVGERMVMEIQDECGGLAPGKLDELLQPFRQRSTDRPGPGRGLSISRRGIEASGGQLSVRNLPGTGCIFSIDLPRQPTASDVDPVGFSVNGPQTSGTSSTRAPKS